LPLEQFHVSMSVCRNTPCKVPEHQSYSMTTPVSVEALYSVWLH